MNIKKIAAFSLSVLLCACGGGGGSGSGTDPLPTVIEHGQLIDAPVSGLGYRSAPSGLNGVTGNNGEFDYKDGDSTTFYIGKVTLGSAASKSVITPLDLVGTDDINNTAVINIARLLQTLDSDNNPDNGIDISVATTQAAENLSDEEALIDFSGDDFAASAQNIINSIDMDLSVLISSDSAKSHLANSIDDPDNDGVINALDDDRDGDGVNNDQDAFPLDADEATDTDSDGVGDNADNCVAVANQNQADTDKDGIGDACDLAADKDSDGITDAEDNCPDDANPEQFDTDGDGMGNECDTDGDSRVATVQDSCDFETGWCNWSYVGNYQTDWPLGFDWRRMSGETATENTGPDSGADDSSYYLYFETSTNNAYYSGNTSQLEGAEFIDLEGALIAFRYHMYGSNTGSLSIDVLEDDVWTEGVWTISGVQHSAVTDEYSSETVDLSAYTVDKIRFTAVNTEGGAYGDIAIDNIVISGLTPADTDGDGVTDNIDSFPFDASETVDTDSDGTGDNGDTDDDNDAILDVSDNCPLVSNTDQTDTDGDRTGNVCDSDDDNDGVADSEDAFPLDATESVDTDSDTVGDNADNCDTVSNSDQADSDHNGVGDICEDDDGDGVYNPVDNCPAVANLNQTDTDDDGDGNACDADDDNDGVADGADAFPLDATETADTDNDGIGDNADNCVSIANLNQADANSNGIGDACDTESDTDSDTIMDSADNCASVANRDQADIDSDGIGDLCDPDNDNDGVINAEDNCPADANKQQKDSDEDGVGNVCDSSSYFLLGAFALDNLHFIADNSQPTYVTFGQVFKQGEVSSGQKVKLIRENGSEWTFGSQIDRKTTYADGSLKHAIITLKVPAWDIDPESKTIQKLMFAAESGNDSTSSVTAAADIIASGFDSVISVDIEGVTWSVSAAELLATATDNDRWLAGEMVTEYLVSGALKDGSENQHPHLQARFNIRAFEDGNIRVAVILENVWAYEPNPLSYQYDIDITVNENTVFSLDDQPHYHHARFRRVYWTGQEPAVSVNYDKWGLIDAGVAPNYNYRTTISEQKLNWWEAQWGADDEHGVANDSFMHIGSLTNYMPATGARADYGILPGWTAAWVVSQDQRARTIMMGNANQSGTWSIHYRDKSKDKEEDKYQILSIKDWPYTGLHGSTGDKWNPVLKRSEVLPISSCGIECWGDLGQRTGVDEFANAVCAADSSHQPSLSFIPYLISGDYYHLEELLFWANFNLIQANPGYRDHEKGLVRWDQTRGQAWSIRTLGQAAYAIPDNHPMKGYFAEILDNNYQWYMDHYVNNDGSNTFLGNNWKNDIGWIGYTWNSTVDYNNDGEKENIGLVSSWMNDFFTASVGHVIELGFDDWQNFMDWHGRYVVGRLYGTDYCAVLAAPYEQAAALSKSGPWFTWGQIYEYTAMFELSLYSNNDIYGLTSLECGSPEMMRYLTDNTPYEFNEGDLYEKYKGATENYITRMQGAIAAAVDAGVTNAEEAWKVFWNRTNPANYTDNPKWDIVPRQAHVYSLK